MEAASGFEPLNGGFADLSLNHLGTPPCAYDSSGAGKLTHHARTLQFTAGLVMRVDALEAEEFFNLAARLPAV